MTDWNELIRDVVAGNWKDPTTGKAATVPFEVIRIEDDLEGGEADMLAPLKLGKRLAVVSDANTHEAMGRRVAGQQVRDREDHQRHRQQGQQAHTDPVHNESYCGSVHDCILHL